MNITTKQEYTACSCDATQSPVSSHGGDYKVTVFWDVTKYSDKFTDVSEKLSVSIFRTEEQTSRQSRSQSHFKTDSKSVGVEPILDLMNRF
jgi:hypothetical protein